ncbi:MAG TPA: hypothetical protein VFU49_08540 [Ktedonobacteraceae bacterium]|nr:hypothetical protein [Ktedonobacteraceae bacterium]
MQQIVRHREHPRRRDIFLHGVKTSKLIGALLKDRRVPIARKLLFLGAIAALLGILLFPDAFNEAFLSIVMPVVGTVLGVPLDAGFDWMAFSLVVVNLLRFFPAAMVAEHYREIFHSR